MKKIVLCLSLLISAWLQAQDNSMHIPSHSTYIVTINPSAHISNGDMTQLSGLDVFTRSNEFGSRLDYLYGVEDLSADRQNAFSTFFTDIFSNPKITGVDTARKIFIFNDEIDSLHYWSYILPIKNSSDFGNYISTHLFTTPPEINKGSGYSSITKERISIGWTNSYAILVLSDYDYHFPSDNIFDLVRAMDSTSVANQMQDAMEHATEDSIAMVRQMQIENDPHISDSVRKAAEDKLVLEQQKMLEQIANDTNPDQSMYQPMIGEQETEYEYVDPSQQLIEKEMDAKVSRQLNYLMNLNYESSVQSIANFRSVNEEQSDAVYWYNYGEMMQQYYEKNMRYRYNYYEYSGLGADTANIQNMWKGSYIVSLIHFEGNVAKMEQRSYFSPTLQERTQGMYNGRVDKKMFRYVKGENLMSFVAMSMDMEKFMKFYGSVYREAANNSMAGMYQNYYMMMWDMMRVFLDDNTLYHLLNGKFLFAVTDLKPYTASYLTYDYDENFNKTEIRKEKTEIRPEFIMVAGIGVEKKAEEILGILERSGAIKKQTSKYYLINTPGEYDIKMFLAIQNGMLIITNNEELMTKHLKKGYGPGQSISKKLRKVGRQSALVAYWDGKKSFDLVKKNMSEPMSDEDKKSIDLLQQDVKAGLIVGKKSKNGIQRIDVTIELNDPQPGSKQTSFVRFFRLLNSLFLVRNNR